ncbi:GntR family transcriptional regulator [Clostridioides sp. ZZV15-6388]|uniref:GntR family transcriptional regulator n=1 Tax=Clostridioides sp. ZZV15-6388 TaxID=2811499 RepID=UPI001D0FC5EB
MIVLKVKSNLDEILYHKIIESLIRGEYSVGQKILLNDLCEKFEVSRTPVVQAVKMLNKDGVLTIMTNGKVYVPEYEYDMVKQVCETRTLIETYALEKMMKEEDDEVFQQKLDTIKKYSDKCEIFYQQGKSVELALTDLKLHKAIVEGANNKILKDIYVGIQGRFIVVNYLIRPLKNRNYEGTVQDHFEILEYIEKRDTKKAVEKLRNHIQGTIKRFCEDE